MSSEALSSFATTVSQIARAGNSSGSGELRYPRLATSNTDAFIERALFEATAHPSDNGDMTGIPREEFDAKQETAAARMDARFAAFQAEVSKSLQANDKAMDQFRLEIAPLKGVKANVWGAAAALGGLFVACFALAIASFDTGRDTSAAIAAGREATMQAVNEAKQLTADSKRLLEEIKANQAAPGK